MHDPLQLEKEVIMVFMPDNQCTNVSSEDCIIKDAYCNILFYTMCIVYCDPGCAHGTCTGPNQCTCNAGWTGADCGIGE